MPEKHTKVASSVFPEYPPPTAGADPDLQFAAALQQISFLYAKHFYPELSVQEWIEKSQWQRPECLDPIPGTERFANRWPKRLKAIGCTYKSFCNQVRLITSLGYKPEEFEVVESNRGRKEAEHTSEKVLHLLCEFQKELVKSEYEKQFPLSPYGAALRHLNKLNRKSDGMAIVLQNPDGSWPKFDLTKYGSGVFAIGNSEPDWHQ